MSFSVDQAGFGTRLIPILGGGRLLPSFSHPATSVRTSETVCSASVFPFQYPETRLDGPGPKAGQPAVNACVGTRLSFGTGYAPRNRPNQDANM